MKYLKKYEMQTIIDNSGSMRTPFRSLSVFAKPRFEVGDIVICDDDSYNGNAFYTIQKGERFIVKSIMLTHTREYICKLSRINDKHTIMGVFYCKNLIKELDYYTNKYNI